MKPTLILAGGGTGGHVFPLLAVARAMQELRPDVRLVFVGTERGMEKTLVPAQGFELELLRVLPMRGGGPAQVVRGVLRAASLVPESLSLLKKTRALGVLSIGGYAAGPVSLAARLAGLPLALIEPNSVAGLANLLIAPFIDRAYTAFDLVESDFAPSVVRSFGVPLRPGFSAVPYVSRPGPKKILVLGGSQGAKALNEVLPEALLRVKTPIEVRHQCGAKHGADVEERYRKSGAGFATVIPFIDDMAAALAESDLVIGRSGASAVSEIAAIGRASILVPYPYASGNHQWKNAEVLERLGAARAIPSAEATAERLAFEVDAVLGTPGRLNSLAENARKFGRFKAAADIARDFFELSGVDCQNPVSRKREERDERVSEEKVD